MSYFQVLDILPEDPILSLPAAFAADKRDKKANLGVGAYRSSEGKPYVLSSVKKAEEWMVGQHFNKEYLPILGDRGFLDSSLQLIYGINGERAAAGEIVAAQTLGGTGALRIGGEMMAEETKTIFVSDPSWPNHEVIFKQAGLTVEKYPYYDSVKQKVNFPGICNAVKGMPPGSAILLHAACHNPTGWDLTHEQWKELSNLIKEQKVMPFFDFAYQGFGTDLDEDAFAIRLFAEQGHEMLVASSCSKNFGLYGERVGMLSICTKGKEAASKVESHVKYLIRALYSNPPTHGAQIVRSILTNEPLHNEWVEELTLMRQRIHEMREGLAAGLTNLLHGKGFSFITKQKGLFSLCGLTDEQAKRMKEEFGVYMPCNGRLNVAALTPANLDFVIKALAEVMRK